MCSGPVDDGWFSNSPPRYSWFRPKNPPRRQSQEQAASSHAPEVVTISSDEEETSSFYRPPRKKKERLIEKLERDPKEIYNYNWKTSGLRLTLATEQEEILKEREQEGEFLNKHAVFKHGSI